MTHKCWPYPGERCELCEAAEPMTLRDYAVVAGGALALIVFWIVAFAVVWVLVQ